ncbi:hypothetical protein CP157_03895 (plasmid) [Paracoccus marcusii]|nr:hypothetical protein CP157_03895 [Paracoccus marcusii]
MYPKGFEPISDVDIDDGEAVRECFQQVCQAIRVKLRKHAAKLEEPLTERRAGRPSRAIAKIYDDLRLKTYILVRDMEGLGVWPHVDVIVARTTPGRRAKNQMTRRFIDVLYFLSQAEGPIGLERKVLADFANQLAYAHRHDVPFQFLLGFLAQVGFDEAARKERADLYEPWHPKYARKPSCGKAKKTSKGSPS